MKLTSGARTEGRRTSLVYPERMPYDGDEMALSLGDGTAFEIVTLLPGFAALTKRSGEIDGNLPVRAARYCGPVFEGSAAGFQISLAQPMTVVRNRRGVVTCDMTAPTLAQVTGEVNDALERGIGEGLIARGGYWHRLLTDDSMPIRANRLTVWTGHMIRPRAGIWVLVGGAYNRRSRLSVVDLVVADPDRFVPLVIEIDTQDVTSKPIWMEGELACAVPMSPSVRMRKEKLTATAPELRQFADFFSEEYFETKTRHPTAGYVRTQRDHRVKADPTCDARLLYVGPDVHQIREFQRFVTHDGFSRRSPAPGSLQFGVVRNIAATTWTWQGQTHSAFDVRNQRFVPELEALWKEAFGDTHPSALAFLRGHMFGEHWDQPYVQFQPWVLAPTSAGWSTLVDGFHGGLAYDGMRAVIATDWFFALAMVFRIYGPSSATIPYRAPMLRALPISRAALELDMRQSTLGGGAAPQANTAERGALPSHGSPAAPVEES